MFRAERCSSTKEGHRPRLEGLGRRYGHSQNIACAHRNRTRCWRKPVKNSADSCTDATTSASTCLESCNTISCRSISESSSGRDQHTLSCRSHLLHKAARNISKEG